MSFPTCNTLTFHVSISLSQMDACKWLANMIWVVLFNVVVVVVVDCANQVGWLKICKGKRGEVRFFLRLIFRFLWWMSFFGSRVDYSNVNFLSLILVLLVFSFFLRTIVFLLWIFFVCFFASWFKKIMKLCLRVRKTIPSSPM